MKEQYEEVLERVFPGNWELNMEQGELIIHFPLFDIINQNGSIHTIKNLFVTANIDEEMLFTDEAIYGLRTSFSAKEVSYNYFHSHLESREISGFKERGTFCLGTGPIIENLIDLTCDADPISFEMFLRQLDIYIKWESIEGTPWRYIEKIAYDVDSSTSPYGYGTSQIREYIGSYRLTRDHIDINYQDGKLSIDKNQKLTDFIMIMKDRLHLPSHMFNKNTDGTFYVDSENLIDNKILEVSRNMKSLNDMMGPFIFKGVSYPLELMLESELPEAKEEELHLHQNIIDRVARVLTLFLNKFYDENKATKERATRDTNFKKLIV